MAPFAASDRRSWRCHELPKPTWRSIAAAHHAGRRENADPWRARADPDLGRNARDVHFNRAGSGRMKSALVLAAAANALVAPTAPATARTVVNSVIQTPPILTREDGLETRPMAADMPGIGQCINQPVSRVPSTKPTPEAGR